MSFRKINFLFVFVLALLFLSSSALRAQQNELQDIQLNGQSDHTQLILTFNQAVSQRIFSLNEPDRVVIDLPDTRLKVQLDQIDLTNSVIDHIRAAQHDERQRLRLVLDLKNAQTIQTHTANVGDGPQLQVIVDLSDPIAQRMPTITIPTHHTIRDVIVIIDPGHGGHDPGATGIKQGLKEKNVVLAIAKTLQKDINQVPGIKAILTRDTDHYVALRERLETAREHDGDLFISIHADAFVNKRAHGASVYTLSSGGASSEAARWLAEKENYSQLGGVDLNTLEDEDNTLRSMLIDLSQIATINQSITLGQGILENLGGVTRLHYGRIEKAGFLVLKSPDIPSVLVETGFISNPTEELNLGSKNFRKQLAHAISAGIQSYFTNNAPPGSLLEAQQKSSIYHVVAGDSLSQIAERKHTSIESLKKLNQLNGDLLMIGQTLLIPN